MEKLAQDMVRQSYGRCLQDSSFFDKFYDRFLSSSDEIRVKFANTDFDKQKLLIKNGINMVIMFANENKVAVNAINRIRDSHSSARMDIPPRLYDNWRTCLLETIKECDPKLEAECLKAWDEVMRLAITHITEGYQQAKAS